MTDRCPCPKCGISVSELARLESDKALLRTRLKVLEADMRNAKEEIARLSAFVPKHEKVIHKPGMVHGP